MLRRFAFIWTFVFVLGLLLAPVSPVDAQGLTLVAQTESAASSIWSGIDIYGITILVQLGIIAVLLLALVRQSGTVKDLVSAEVITAIVDTVVNVTKQTSTTLDDMVAEDILKPLVENILASLETETTEAETSTADPVGVG